MTFNIKITINNVNLLPEGYTKSKSIFLGLLIILLSILMIFKRSSPFYLTAFHSLRFVYFPFLSLNNKYTHFIPNAESVRVQPH